MSQDLSASLQKFRMELRDIVNEDIHEYADVQRIKDAADLIGVLAHIVAGKDMRQAFGAPGDWGYDTPIGRGVASLYAKQS